VDYFSLKGIVGMGGSTLGFRDRHFHESSWAEGSAVGRGLRL